MWSRSEGWSGTRKHDPPSGAHTQSISALPPDIKRQPALAFVAPALSQAAWKKVMRLGNVERPETGAVIASFLCFVPAGCIGREAHRRLTVWTDPIRSEIAWSQKCAQRLSKWSATGIPSETCLRKVRETCCSDFLIDPSSLRVVVRASRHGFAKSHAALHMYPRHDPLAHMQGRNLSSKITNGDNPVKAWLPHHSGCVDYPRLDSCACATIVMKVWVRDHQTIAGAHVDIIPWSRNS